MERYRIYVGNREISWNQTTWKDWLPVMIIAAFFSVGLSLLLVLETIIYIRGL